MELNLLYDFSKGKLEPLEGYDTNNLSSVLERFRESNLREALLAYVSYDNISGNLFLYMRGISKINNSPFNYNSNFLFNLYIELENFGEEKENLSGLISSIVDDLNERINF